MLFYPFALVIGYVRHSLYLMSLGFIILYNKNRHEMKQKRKMMLIFHHSNKSTIVLLALFMSHSVSTDL